MFTFLGEELLGVFACQDQLPRNFAEQLDDQCYVIYGEAAEHTQTQLMKVNRPVLMSVFGCVESTLSGLQRPT